MLQCETQKAGTDSHTSTCCRDQEGTLATGDKHNQANLPDKYKLLLKKTTTGPIIATTGKSTLKLLNYRQMSYYMKILLYLFLILRAS